MYALSGEESNERILLAEDVEGFFVDLSQPATGVSFLGVHMLACKKGTVDDAILNIIDRDHVKIGEYFIGRAELSADSALTIGRDVPRVYFKSFGSRCEFPDASVIWQRWAMSVPAQNGEWCQLSPVRQDAWLHVVQNCWFTSGHSATRYGDSDVAHLDGVAIGTKTAFY